MKLLILIAAILILAAFGWYLASPMSDRSNHSDRSDQTDHYQKPTATLTDPTVVFERAFWKHLSADDHILHAERREWSSGDGVKKWQWFIAVQPSPQLVKYLRDDNAFNLAPATAPSAGEDAPEWFRFAPAEVEAFTAPAGSMALAFSKAGNVLYATDSGTGFRPGAAEPAPAPIVQTEPSGRLPKTSPPKP